MIIKRAYGIIKNTYSACAEVSITGTARNTHSILPHSIYAEDTENKFVAKQTNFLLKILGGIPLINLVVFAPFRCYLNNSPYGKMKKICMKPVLVFEMEDNIYELRLCTGDVIDLTQNGKLIVRYKKEPYSRNEEHTYEVETEDACLHNVFIMAFCIFADAVFYPTKGFDFRTNRYEKKIALGKRCNL